MASIGIDWDKRHKSNDKYNKSAKGRANRWKHVKRGKAQKQAFLMLYKAKGCVQCGYKSNMRALEVHHTGERDVVHRALYDLSWDRLFTTLKSCIVLCSNCHKEFHAQLHAGSQLSQATNEILEDPDEITLLLGKLLRWHRHSSQC